MSETTAMRKTSVAVIAAAFLCAGPIGCKSAAKMAWWKAGDKTDVESTALAHSAPALPADVAKQAESYATSAPSIQMSGGEAAPYSPAPAFSPGATAKSATPTGADGVGAMAASTTNPSTYPSTGALPYSAAPNQAAAPAYASADRSADLGAVDMPYNPNAVPPARTVATVPATTPNSSIDRYAMSAAAPTPSSGTSTPTVTNVATPQLSGDRYGNSQLASARQTAPAVPPAPTNFASAAYPAAGTISPAPVYSAPVNSAPVESGSAALAATGSGSGPSSFPTGNAPGAGNLTGSRYATNDSPAQPNPPGAASVTPLVVTPTAVVAAASPYRPGGTASYAGSAVEIASRPSTVETQVPNPSSPSLAPEPSQAPRYR